MAQDSDILLRDALRDWIASLPPGTASLCAMAPRQGGDSGFLVTPARAGAVPIRLGLAASPGYLTFRVGRSAHWDDLPLSADSVAKLCSSVACGGFLEETWTLGRLTLAHQASLIVGGDQTLHWGTRGPSLLIPFSRRVRRAPEPWLG